MYHARRSLILICSLIVAIAFAAQSSRAAQLPNSLSIERDGLAATTAPCPSAYPPVGATDQCLYALGGSSLPYVGGIDQVEALNPNSHSGWVTLPNAMNEARFHLAAATAPCPGSTGTAAANQCVYAIGGEGCIGGCHVRSTVEYYDPSTGLNGTWHTLTNGMTQERDNLGAATAPCPSSTRICIYAVGGYYNLPVNTVDYYDPSTGDTPWTALPPLKLRRAGADVTSGPCPGILSSGRAAAQPCLYAIGGFGGTSPTGYDHVLNTMEVYDAAAATTSTWTMLPGPNKPRGSAGTVTAPCPGTTGLATDPQCLWVMGGDDGGLFEMGNALSSIEYWNPSAGTASTNTWHTSSRQLSTVRSGLGAATASCPGTTTLAKTKRCMYAIAGEVYTYAEINSGQYKGIYQLASVDYFDTNNPTAARVSHFAVRRAASRLTFTWRAPSHAGVIGFRLYARHTAISTVLPLHAASKYSYQAHPTRGPFSLHVLLRDGLSQTVTP